MSNQAYAKAISLKDIPNKEYFGYLWYSDAREPNIYEGMPFSPPEGDNPFIVEGNLIATDGSVSITIRHVGNQTLTTEFGLADIDSIPDDQKTVREYIAHRLKGYSKICFEVVWLPQPANNEELKADGFETLKPTFNVFKGLKK